ncbi:MAG: gliding motility-associated C-terminal domain-containing protein [Flavobacteriales bacterium]
MKKKILSALAAIMSCAALAQEYNMGTPNISDCGGFLVDSGFSSGDYEPNENLTTTVCHDGTGDGLVSLYFSFCDLGTGDEISFYDGVDANAPFIASYTGTDLQSLDITSTNVDGCITVVFISNGDTEVGSFGAQISCTEPCDRPEPVITTTQEQEGAVLLCVGESITLDGSSSTFEGSAVYASHVWDFDDGTTDNTNWPTVTHTFTQPGAYVVQLYLTDDAGCTSGILPDKLVYVATQPDMAISASDYFVCTGQSVDIDIDYAGVLWTSLPDVNLGGDVFIPDDQTQCFSDTLLFSGFDPGLTITDALDIDFFYINFEHSFMGDIVISFICPDGTSIAVHQQGGGGTWLGEPVDDETLTPGVGYDYYWAPDATNGTWVDNSGTALPAGTYESVQPISDLIGCPLNGEWIVEICDMWAIDNGFIFDWSVQFAPYMYPDLISFTPEIGSDCDSTYVSGEWIVNSDADCDHLQIVPDVPGVYDYLFTAVDNHGCTYTETISIEAYEGPEILVSEDIYYCGNDVQISGVVTNPNPNLQYLYQWSPGNLLNNSSIPEPTIVNDFPEDQNFILFVNPTDDPECIVSDTLMAFVPTVPPIDPLTTDTICNGEHSVFEAPGIDEGYYYTWYYSPTGSDSVEVASNSTGMYAGGEAGYYYVVVTEPNCGLTSVTDYVVFVENCTIKIPNVFTPNNDGENDTFEIFGLDKFPNSTVRIYNRWGGLVYESDNYHDQWGGSEHSDGTYYFILGVNKNDDFEYYEGHVTMLRD